MPETKLATIGFACCALAVINAGMWALQYRSERRWKFIGAETAKWCAKRMWLNVLLAMLFAAFGVAGVVFAT